MFYLLNGYQLFEDEVFGKKFAASKTQHIRKPFRNPSENFYLKAHFANNGGKKQQQTNNLSMYINENTPLIICPFSSILPIH